MTVREAQARIDSREFAEWQAYAEIEPFGELRADLRAGIIAATMANAQRRKGGRRWKPKDFMPDFSRRRRRQTTAQLWASFKRFAKRHNARQKSGKG